MRLDAKYTIDIVIGLVCINTKSESEVAQIEIFGTGKLVYYG